MTFALGQKVCSGGCVTRLNWIDARSPSRVEVSLGYQAGRLAQGYFIGLLVEKLRPNHVRFGGLTLRSGGRDGLPEADPVQDWLRPQVHDRMLQEYGTQSVGKMLEALASDPRNLSGGERIAKIFPAVRHKGDNPAEEYPAGGGGPQFLLTDGHDFLLAAEVSPVGIASTAQGWSVSVAENAPYEDRARLVRYLQAATA